MYSEIRKTRAVLKTNIIKLEKYYFQETTSDD